ncbi:MAG: GspH/FimT family pseudopilin [Nitrosomonadales bacterium]|nr:GspH/FimT family pseudopilin [Nitrosomonadales bacterium]
MERKQRGVTMIELLIAIVIMGLLMTMGMPAFNLWTQNIQTRGAAESILNGLQLARTEAVRRNTNVRLDLTDATGVVSWTVGCVTVTADCPANIQSYSNEAGKNARVGVSVAALPAPIPANHFDVPLTIGNGLPAGVTFDGIGRMPVANIGADISRIDVMNAANANARRMVIVVEVGGQVRMCDPALPRATNPQGCA